MSKYWSDTEFIETVKASKTIYEVLEHFGISRAQAYYYRVFRNSIKTLNIDTSHFRKTGRGAKPEPLSSVLTRGKYRSSSDLRKRLIREGVLQNVCSGCGMGPTWAGKTLTLQLDHINGDNTDNRIENLRLLCPNCHSQTDTYCGNKKDRAMHRYVFVCKTCGKPKKNNGSENCMTCWKEIQQKRQTKVQWPAPNIVLQMVKESNFVSVGKQLGVSDNAVRKFLKRNGLTFTTRKSGRS